EYIIPVDNTFSSDYTEALDSDNSYLYVGYTNPASATGGFLVLDISNPGFPVFVSNYSLNSAVFKVLVKDGIAFVGTGAGTDNEGVVILDITKPANPIFLNQIQLGANIARDIFIANNHLYIAADEGGLVVFDVTDVSNPQFVSVFGVNGFSYGAAVKSNTLYLANSVGKDAFTVLDATDMTNIKLIGNYDTPGRAEGIAIKDNYIYIVDGWDITIFKEGSVTSVDDDLKAIPEQFSLAQNFPNPFNPSTTINYELKVPAIAHIRIYNTSGQLVITLVEEYKTPGKYSVVWNGRNDKGQKVSSGVYIYKSKFDDKLFSKKMVLLK
ncbi:T9SS type A sorting domain-containing protein, partial [candidate division KSB1 bacterium]|nr:T9SS type A sorting domain-containing protein [candidate division KSB1 bacterium]